MGIRGEVFESRFDHFVRGANTKGAALAKVSRMFSAALDGVPIARCARRYVAELAECVRRGLDEPAEKVARAPRRDMPPQLNLLGQFLMAALTSLCRRAEIAPSIVGTASDVRELIAHRLGFGANDPADMPKLARGWRADLVGDNLNDILSGKTSIRIADPLHGEPLEFLNGG